MHVHVETKEELFSLIVDLETGVIEHVVAYGYLGNGKGLSSLHREASIKEVKELGINIRPRALKRLVERYQDVDTVPRYHIT